MIDSWKTTVTENRMRSDFFNPMIPVAGRDSGRYPNEVTKGDYEKYAWLFRLQITIYIIYVISKIVS